MCFLIEEFSSIFVFAYILGVEKAQLFSLFGLAKLLFSFNGISNIYAWVPLPSMIGCIRLIGLFKQAREYINMTYIKQDSILTLLILFHYELKNSTTK